MNSSSEKQSIADDSSPALEETPASSENQWSPECIRQLRLRMGWSRTDLARRLKYSTEQIQDIEEGRVKPQSSFKSEIEILLRQAEVCSDEIRLVPTAENKCDKDALQQIDFAKVQAEFE